MPVRLRKEVQALLRWADDKLIHAADSRSVKREKVTATYC